MLKLTDAAKQGKAQIVIDAIHSGVAVDLQQLLRKVFQDFHTIRKGPGHQELAEYLLAAGAQPERELVYEAARGGHANLITLLLDRGLERDLFVAAALGETKEVELHLSSIHECDSQGMTPLHYGCGSSVWRGSPDGQQRQAETTSRLLQGGADPNATSAYCGLVDVTPLFCVAWTGGHIEIANQLLTAGAKITPNVFFAAVGHFQRHGDGNYEIAALLLKHGFDINAGEERMALHAFAAHEDARGVAWLLDHGADVDARDADGNTPLIAAAKRNSGVKVIQQLIDAGADLAAVNNAGLDALHAAQIAGKSKTTTLLQQAITSREAT
ncbi:ankyrin repeat domain-containing protein [Blastopirellula sp. JC732]|uniref:Ankyrin repeat domain-containing protein n=1 Tax=Blastopirellula sediminis TaxID=2894196 RepID=A0A9X1SHA5_9BACT|nr:ankyrin repeat domain-containing protein [Blastopirellula sediminis]MCC9606751.1 ankyrin repeat domain-containing protein [Blastopirellula sediminis]MCC9629952.1 ankyrin repeat domain-containing protein [Blastopirellula sediminis]